MFLPPARAKAAYGKDTNDVLIAGHIDFIKRALSGENLFEHPQYPNGLLPPAMIEAIKKNEPAHEGDFTAKFERWLKEQKK